MKKLKRSHRKTYFAITIFFIISASLGLFIRYPSSKEHSTINRNQNKKVLAIYSSNYGNFENDVSWFGWKVPIISQINEFLFPFVRNPTQMKPKLGYYSLNNENIIETHMKMIKSANIQGILINWTRLSVYNHPEYKSQIIVMNNYPSFQNRNVTETFINIESIGINDPILNVVRMAALNNISVGLSVSAHNRSTENIIQEIKIFQQITKNNDNSLMINDKFVIMIDEDLNFTNNINFFKQFYLIQNSEQCNNVYSAFQSIYSAFTCFNFSAQLFEPWRKRNFDIIPTVMPGFNESRRDLQLLHKTIGRNDGLEYIHQWKQAFEWGGDIIIINSFNNWIQNTAIESALVERRDPEKWSGIDSESFIKLTKQLSDQFHQI